MRHARRPGAIPLPRGTGIVLPMRRHVIERIRARWVTGPVGHGAAFGIDVAFTFRLWLRWRLLVARERRG